MSTSVPHGIWQHPAARARAAAELELRRRRAAPSSSPLTFRRVPLYPKQAAIVDDPARFTITEATTKAGKTMSHIEWLLGEADRIGHGNLWWVATINDTADIAYRRTQERLRGLLDSSGELIRVGDPVPFTKNDTRKFVDVFGARIWFKSADKPDSLFGEDVYALVGDEISRWKEDAWTACYSTLTATKGRAKLIGNVKGRKNFAYRLARKAEGNGSAEGWSYHKLTALDAIAGGVIDEATVEEARRDLPPDAFAELYMAEAAEDGSNPFGMAAIKACIVDAPSLSPTTAYGVDLAKSVDYTWIVGLDAEGRQTTSERFQKPWGETEAEVLRLVGSVPAAVDSTGVGDPIVEAMQRKARRIEGFKFSSTSKQQLMEGLAAAIQQQRLRIWDARLIAELEAFEYEHTRTGVKYSAPSGLHDDGVCALALAVMKNSRPVFASSIA